jgi:uncharacterized protein YggE
MKDLFDTEGKERFGKLLIALVAVASLWMGMKFINEVKAFSSIGEAPSAQNTIDVAGEGESFAVADVAAVNFTVEQKAATVHDAQETVTKKVNDVLSYLKSAGIADKDIKTTSYSAYPEYNYPNCPDSAKCVSRTPELVGFTVSQTILVKIRDTATVGTIVDGIGSRGVTGMSGPDYTIDNPDAVQADARKMAIADAKTKAEALAKQLGVHLGHIVRFSENTGNQPSYYKATDAYGMGGTGAASTPQVPAGENKYTSDITITYEIR